MIRVDRLTTTVECVSLDEVKTALRVDFIQFDNMINTAMLAAREWVERHTSTYWAKGTARVTIANEATPAQLTWAGVNEVIADESNTGADVQDGKWGFPEMTFDADITDPVSITVTVGTETPPAAVREAIILLTGNLYASKMGDIGNTTAIQMILQPYKKHLFI